MRNKRLTTTTTSKTRPYQHEPRHELHMEHDEYMKINMAFADELWKYLITTGRIVKLPSMLGELQIIKYKSDKKLIDFNATKQEGFTIYHDNMETQGWRVRLFWHKRNAKFKNKSYWALKPTRYNSRLSEHSLNKYPKAHGVYHLFEN